MSHHRRSGPIEIRVLLAGLALAVVALAGSGCGYASEERVKIITSREFATLQNARTKISRMLADLERATDAALPPAERQASAAAVVEKYREDMPGPGIAPTNEHPDDFDRLFRGTTTGDLMEMNRSLSWKDEDGTSMDAISAWYVANDYLAAIENMYGLEDFMGYLALHTMEDGTRINPANPPDMPPGSMRVFGNAIKGAGVGVNVSYDDEGNIKYVLYSNSSIWSVRRDASVPDIEARLVVNAREAVSEGDGILVERADLD